MHLIPSLKRTLILVRELQFAVRPLQTFYNKASGKPPEGAQSPVTDGKN